MGWSGFDDSDLDDDEDPEGSRQNGRRKRKRFDEDEDHGVYKQKRSGKRFHRKKTHKDDFWPEDDRGGSNRHGRNSKFSG
jgi:hypothetical protein